MHLCLRLSDQEGQEISGVRRIEVSDDFSGMLDVPECDDGNRRCQRDELGNRPLVTVNRTTTDVTACAG
jgi:hypothetical protein